MKSLRDLGEKKVIDIILNCLDIMPNIPVPFGDDASAFEIEGGKLAVLKTDMLVGSTDVPRGMDLRQAARKAIVMNVSDMASKGVKPSACLVSLGLPKNLEENDIENIGFGLNDGAREYGTYVLGGDTNESSELIIDCFLIGFCDKADFIRRNGAQPGDILAVTGFLGKSASGLRILMEDLNVDKQMKEKLTQSVLMPKARLREGLAVTAIGGATSSIDSSDGLSFSLYELSESSEVGFVVEDLPVAPEVLRFAEEFDLSPLDLCLYGGEEYELVFTIKEECWEDTRKAVEELGTSLTRIGKATKDTRILLETDDVISLLDRRGWEHFKR